MIYNFFGNFFPVFFISSPPTDCWSAGGLLMSCRGPCTTKISDRAVGLSVCLSVAEPPEPAGKQWFGGQKHSAQTENPPRTPRTRRKTVVQSETAAGLSVRKTLCGFHMTLKQGRGCALWRKYKEFRSAYTSANYNWHDI